MNYVPKSLKSKAITFPTLPLAAASINTKPIKLPSKVDRIFFTVVRIELNVDAFDMVPEISSLVAQRLKHLPGMQETWV